MNCRHVQDALSPYIDGRLTGETMLLIQRHLDGCRACTEEYIMISEAKDLLRSLPIYSPTSASERALKQRLAYSQVPGMIPQSMSYPPPRGRRLVTALAMSCLGSLVVAAPFGSGTLNLMAMRPLGFSALAHLEQRHDPIDTSSIISPLRPMPGSMMLQAEPANWTASAEQFRGRSPYNDTSYMGTNAGYGYGGQVDQPVFLALNGR